MPFRKFAEVLFFHGSTEKRDVLPYLCVYNILGQMRFYQLTEKHDVLPYPWAQTIFRVNR